MTRSLRLRMLFCSGLILSGFQMWSPTAAAPGNVKSTSPAKTANPKAANPKTAGPKSGGPKTPEEFAAQYMAAFNKKDKASLERLRYPATGKSPMQEMIDEMVAADMNSGTQYTKFEVFPVDGTRSKSAMGLDGMFYRPNLTPAKVLKLSAVTRNGSSSTTFPIGVKDGVYYQVALVKQEADQPDFNFGWQRFDAPQAGWSVMLPNEPEPGKAALEKETGKSVSQNADVYGVVRNTADIKTTQHFFHCGSEGKRVSAQDNKETYRASRTTYEPETLKKWFGDPKKTLEDTVDLRVRSLPGKLVKQTEIELSGAPGREFEIKGDDGAYSLGRVYWIKDALYELTFETRDAKPDVVSANRFLGSLEVK